MNWGWATCRQELTSIKTARNAVHGSLLQYVPEIIHSNDLEEAVSIIEQMITQDNEVVEHFAFVIEEGECNITTI